MKMGYILAMALLSASPLAWSQDNITPSASPTQAPSHDTPQITSSTVKKLSKKQMRVQEDLRKQELSEHTAWQWSMGVIVQDKSSGKTQEGILIGMQAQGHSGPVRSMGWLNAKGEPQWASIRYPSDDGYSWKFRVGTSDAEWQADTDGKMLARHVRETLGFEVDIMTLNAWVNGLSAHKRQPRKLTSDEAGVHPQEVSTPLGKLTWDGWAKVQTGDGFDLSLPGAWTLVSRNYLALFQVASVEAYKPDELPVDGWPFVEKSAPRFVIQDEAPIVEEKELDYRTW